MQQEYYLGIMSGTSLDGVDVADNRLMGKQHGNIADPADVQHHRRPTFIIKQRLMKSRHQRRPLSAECHILTPKIAHHVNAGARCKQMHIANLQGKRKIPLRRVPHGLPVAADGADMLRR